MNLNPSEFKKYLLLVAIPLILNVLAAYLYDFLKVYTANGPQPSAIAVILLIVANLVFSILLIYVVKCQERKNFMKRTAFHHTFAHNARNLAVKLMARKPVPPHHAQGDDPIPLTGDSHYLYREDIVQLLEALSNMFEQLVPKGVKVWACLRERRSDDQYYTWARSSRCNPTRQEFSEPLHKDSVTITRLKRSYEARDCVIVTGSQDPSWHKRGNDDYKEDLCVLMGAVLSKSWNGQTFDDPKLNWVLCVNADRANVFTHEHISLMKTCNDVFSWLLNSFIRVDATKNNWSSAPKKANNDITA